MLPVFFVLIIVSCLISEIMESEVTQQTATQGYQPLWRYDEQKKWPGLRCKIGGRRQSPIDIQTKSVKEDMGQVYIKNGPLVFKGYESVLMSAINNGHTIQFSTDGEEEMHPQLSGGPLNTAYRLEQLHFHWTSEHALDGVKFPMEVHFVHVRSDLTVFEAVNQKDGLAIIAVFCKVQSDLDELPANTKQVMNYIAKIKNTGDRISGLILDMSKWLSPDRTFYYTYSGSLTSPKCNEAVTWIIFKEPIAVAESQYNLISKVGFGRVNARSLQNISQHVVYCPPHSKIRIPEFIKYAAHLYNAASILIKNVTTALATGISSEYAKKNLLN